MFKRWWRWLVLQIIDSEPGWYSRLDRLDGLDAPDVRRWSA